MSNLNTIELSDNENSPLRVDGPYYINFSDDSNMDQSENKTFSVGQYEEVGDKRVHELEYLRKEQDFGILQ